VVVVGIVTTAMIASLPSRRRDRQDKDLPTCFQVSSFKPFFQVSVASFPSLSAVKPKDHTL